jgi:hypothetical protein
VSIEEFGGWADGAARALRRRRRLRPDLRGERPSEPGAPSTPRALAPCPGWGLRPGITVTLLSLVVLLPIGRAARGRGAVGPGRAVGRDRRATRTLAALVLSFRAAWSRRSSTSSSASCSPGCWCATPFPGRRLVDAAVDLPFALPTAVAGIALTALYAPERRLGGPQDLFGARVAYTEIGHLDRAGLRGPALRGPHRAAGDRGDRAGGRGGLGHAGRHAAHHPAAGVSRRSCPRC